MQADRIMSLLLTQYGDLTVGKPGRSFKLRQANALSDAGCAVKKLPAGSTPTTLPGGDGVFGNGCNSSIPEKGGKWQNVLLGQTLTLAFNIRYDGFLHGGPPSGLGGLLLCPSMITQGSLVGADGKPGSGDEIIDPGPDNILGTNDDPRMTVTIPNAVYCAISAMPGGPTVNNLLELANRALGGQTLPAGVTIPDVNFALNSVNTGFDRCRFLVGCTGSCSSNDSARIQQGEFTPAPVPASVPQPQPVQRTADRQDLRGFALWSLDYNSCNGDPACIQKKQAESRSSGSALTDSSEQSDWISRVYQTAYGATRATTSDQLVLDTRLLNRGVNTSRDGWEYMLESNKQTFADQFVRRDGFASAYPTTMTPAVLVDRLFKNAGVTPSQQDRDAAIKTFSGARNTSNLAARARVLRMIAER
jgi:hypothetical protein